MQETVVTIVGKIDGGLVDKAAALIRETGVSQLEVNRLDPQKAVDIFFSPNNAELTRLLYQKLQNLGSYDIFIQPNDRFRKKRLLVADMDATMVVGETLDDLAAHLGIKDKIAPITAQAMKGEIDFKEALDLRISLLKGMPVGAIFEAVTRMEYSKGAIELIRTMNRFGNKCILISGGFDYFTKHAAEELGFWKNFGNRLEIANDQLTGRVIPPIVDKTVKKDTLEREARGMNVDLRHTMAIGDGANDIPMLQAAGAGVGYFGKPAVIAATPYQVRHTDLTALLYMQGYKSGEIY